MMSFAETPNGKLSYEEISRCADLASIKIRNVEEMLELENQEDMSVLK